MFHDDKPAHAKNRHARTPAPNHRCSPASPWFHLWKYATLGLSALGVGFLLSGLFFFQGQMLSSKESALEDFNWLVLVNGDQLTIDEIGRFLQQHEGVKEVSFLSPEAVFDRIRNEGIAEEDLALLQKTSLSPAWQIAWSPRSFRLGQNIRDVLWDIRRFPGVMDVAYNREILKNINVFRHHLLQVRLVVSIFVFLLVAVTALLLGRVLFFMEISAVSFKNAWRPFVWDFACWSLGVLLCVQLLGPVSLKVLWGGLIFATLHSLVLIFQSHKA